MKSKCFETKSNITQQKYRVTTITNQTRLQLQLGAAPVTPFAVVPNAIASFHASLQK
jgi:hypothetical protein